MQPDKPASPTEQPPTEQPRRPSAPPASGAPGAPDPQTTPSEPVRVRHSRTSSVWIGAIVAAILLILLLIFITQNTDTVTVHFFGLAGGLPVAVALLFAAVCGVLLVAIPGTVRILQLRKAVNKAGASKQRRQ